MIVTLLQDLPALLVYVVIAAIVLAETAALPGVVLPTLTVLLVAGFLARIGTVDLIPILAVAMLAALAGDQWAYREGRRFGPRLRESRAGRWVGPARWAKADVVLDRRGGWAVLLGRLVTVVRTLVPRLAGASGMPYARFVAFNTLGVMIWATLEIGAGYAAGASYERLASRMGHAALAAAVLAGGLTVVILGGRWLGGHREPAVAVGQALARAPFTRRLAREYLRALVAVRTRFGEHGALAVTAVLTVVIILVAGYLTGYLSEIVVHLSGASAADRSLASWLISVRDERLLTVAVATVTAVRGSFVLAAVLAAAIVVATRQGPGERRLRILHVLALFVPLVAMAAVIDRTQPHDAPADPSVPVMLFPGQHAVVAAGLGLLAWLLSSRSRWPIAVAAWTSASFVLAVLTGARLYVGWSAASQTAAAVLLGTLWCIAVIAVGNGDPRRRRAAAGDEQVETATGVGAAPTCDGRVPNR